jgi:enterochelin esterase-like enzyme
MQLFMKQFIVLIMFTGMSLNIISGAITVSDGTLIHYEQFKSNYIAAHNIDVWLPDGYSKQKKYSVLYMQDGQMLFDSSTTWNHQEWSVDETISRLLSERKIKDCIVVGIWNSGAGRHADYFPQKVFESLSMEEQKYVFNSVRVDGSSVFNNIPIHSDDYLKFVVTELKPFIDSTYSTQPKSENTFIAGSSMGALICLYAICEYPEIFGGAICMSTHWPGIFTLDNNPVPDAMIFYLQNHLPNPKTHKIYFDHGTETLDSMYPAIQKRVNTVMKQNHYKSKNWITKEFIGADHSESAWRKRFDIPLQFMLKL